MTTCPNQVASHSFLQLRRKAWFLPALRISATCSEYIFGFLLGMTQAFASAGIRICQGRLGRDVPLPPGHTRERTCQARASTI